jgi:Amt family ammonium transporter
MRIDDVLGVWPLHGITGSWGGIAAGIFGQKALGGIGGVSFFSQFAGTIAAVIFALLSGTLIYLALKNTCGIRMSKDEELRGSDLSIHKIGAYPERDIRDTGLFSQNTEEEEHEIRHRNNPTIKT